MNPLVVSRTVLLLALLVLSACGPDFEPYWRVNKFRVLAIKAEPVVIGQGETAKLTAATYDPEGAQVEYRWEWCPFRVSSQNSYECPVTVEQINQMVQEQAPEGQTPPPLPDDFFELGDEQTVDFQYPASQEMIRGFCQAIVDAIAQAGEDSPLGSQLPVSDCSEGFEVSVRMVATTPDDEIIARKRVLLATGEETSRNLNPEVTGMRIQLEKPEDAAKVADRLDWVAQLEDDDEVEWHDIPVSDPTPVVANIPYNLLAVVAPSSVETWRPPAPEGSEDEFLPPEEEAFSFRWFASAGDLDETRGLFAPEQNTLEKAGISQLNIPYNPSKSDYDQDGVDNDADNCAPLSNPDQLDSNDDGIGDGCDVYLWSVVRDARLGLDYVERRVRVVGWE